MGNHVSSSYDILNTRLDELKQKESAAAEEANRLRAIAENAEVGDQKIVELNQDLARLKARQEELSKAGVGLGYKEYDQNAAKIQQLNTQLHEYEKSLSKVNKQESVLNRLTNTLSGKFDKASSAVKRMAAMSGKGIAAMKNLGRHSDQTGMSLLRVIQTTILFGGVSRLLQMLTIWRNWWLSEFSTGISSNQHIYFDVIDGINVFEECVCNSIFTDFDSSGPDS